MISSSGSFGGGAGGGGGAAAAAGGGGGDGGGGGMDSSKISCNGTFDYCTAVFQRLQRESRFLVSLNFR